MKKFRIVVGILAIIPVAMLVDAIFLNPASYGPGTLGELLYPIFGIPILIFNLWAWVHPEIIEFYFSATRSADRNSLCTDKTKICCPLNSPQVNSCPKALAFSISSHSFSKIFISVAKLAKGYSFHPSLRQMKYASMASSIENRWVSLS